MANKGKRAKCIEEGILNEQYTLEGWFVKVKPVLSLDKNRIFETNKPSVLFAFVKKGTNGEGFDIYVDIDIFDNWADDVLDITKTFQKTIEAEKAAGKKYPETYKYTTGNNGEKSVGFCPSTVKGAFCTVNGCTVKDGKKIFANVPVDMDWMRTTCKWFKRIANPWFVEKAKETLKNASSNTFREDLEDEAPIHDSSKEIHNNNNVSNSSKKNDSETFQAKESTSKSSYEVVKKRFISSSSMKAIQKRENCYCIMAKTDENQEVKIVFLNEEISKMDESVWKNFQSSINKKSTTFMAQCAIRDNVYYFKNLEVK